MLYPTDDAPLAAKILNRFSKGMTSHRLKYWLMFAASSTCLSNIWRDSDYATKLEFQSMILPEGTIFDIKAQGFETKGLSLLYRLSLNKKDLSIAEKSLMVSLRGSSAKHFWDGLERLGEKLKD